MAKKYIYEVIKGFPVTITPTGEKDETCPRASFSRLEYKILDYGKVTSRFPNDLIYVTRVDAKLFKEVK